MNRNKTHIAIIAFAALLFVLLVQSGNAQSRMVMSNNVYMVIDNSAKLVITNPNSNALTTSGTGGNIVSENENDKIKWNIGTTTGIYTLPFSTASGVKIPFSMNITSAGTGSGHFLFSTYTGSTWDNFTYKPSDVTHMNNLYTGANNSANVIDRFWIIDAQSYTTKPSVTMSFTYVDAEHSAAGNTITEANLGAQRFNTVSNTWGDFAPTGTVNTVSNTVSGITVSPSNLFRSWTLSMTTNPLPVELLSYSLECSPATLNWTTASESNNNYFIVEKSGDGLNFDFYKQVTGAGTTNFQNDYAVAIETGNFYYRLSQVDFDGQGEILGMVYNTCRENEFTLWQPVNIPSTIMLNGLVEGELQLRVYDLNGKLIWNDVRGVESGQQQIQINNPASGIYMVHAKNNGLEKVLKIVL